MTLDLGFGNPLVFKPSEFAGIAVLHLPSNPTQADLLLVCCVLSALEARGDIAGKLWSVHRGFNSVSFNPDRHDDG